MLTALYLYLRRRAGRENTETRGDGNVRVRAHYHVLRHVGSLDP